MYNNVFNAINCTFNRIFLGIVIIKLYTVCWKSVKKLYDNNIIKYNILIF